MANLRNILAIVAIGAVLLVGVAMFTVFRAPEAASGPIEAIPVAETSAGAATSAATSATTDTATDPSSATSVADTAPTQAAATAAPATDASTTSEAAATESEVVVLQIAQGESEARFIIDEVLNNAPKTVVGSTDQVAGEIAVDAQDPSKTRVGVIQVNARALATDSNFRDRAIKNQILQTDQYEFITFTPTEIVGLPETGAVGESYTFQMIGDLTIRDVTTQVTFDVTATAASETRLEGTAKSVIRYDDYGITIPSVPQVASVEDEVGLEIDFVATTAS